VTYTPTTWVANTTVVSAVRMNNIEGGIVNAVPADDVVVAGTRIVASKLLAADAQPAWRVLGSGHMDWGSGAAAAPDTNLYRDSGGATLATDSNFFVNGYTYHQLSTPTLNAFATWLNWATDTQPHFAFRNDGRMAWGLGGTTAADTSLYRSAAGWLTTDGTLVVTGKTGYNPGLRITGASGYEHALQIFKASADPSPVLVIEAASAKLEWGPGGSASIDTNLYRAAASVLQTDGVLIADHRTSIASVTTARTGGAAAALPAAPVRYLAVLDENGNRVYVPAYS
jgi:hypothetical protein